MNFFVSYHVLFLCSNYLVDFYFSYTNIHTYIHTNIINKYVVTLFDMYYAIILNNSEKPYLHTESFKLNKIINYFKIYADENR